MNNAQHYKWMEELRQQCRFATLAFQETKRSLNGMDSERTFYHLYAFLRHAQSVADALWPGQTDAQSAAAADREALGVTAKSPLQLRGLRTAAGDADQFRQWLLAQNQPDYVNFNLMPTAAIGDSVADRFQRSLDPDTFRLVWRGATCDLKPVADALRALESGVDAWLKTHQPW